MKGSIFVSVKNCLDTRVGGWLTQRRWVDRCRLLVVTGETKCGFR